MLEPNTIASPKSIPTETVKSEKLKALPAEWSRVAESYFGPGPEALPPIPSQEALDRFLPSALLLIDNGDFQSAEKILEHLFEKFPQENEVLKWLGFVHQEKGNFKRALFFYQKWAEIKPCEESFFQLAHVCYALEEMELARIFYEKAVVSATFDSAYLFESYKNLGNIFLKAGDIEAAEENYNKAYTLVPHSDILLVNYGTLGLQKGDLELAATRFSEALALNQNNDRAWIGMAFVQRRKGDLDLSWATLQRGLDVNPENLVGLHASMEWALEDNKVDVALEHVQFYLDRVPTNREISYCKAGLLFKLGRLQESTDYLGHHMNLFPNHPQGLELLGIIKSRQGAK